MKFVYQGHQPLSIVPGHFTVLGTNNRQVYLELINGIQEVNEKVTLFDDNYQQLTMSTALDWDGDVIANRSLSAHYATEIIKTIVRNLTNEDRQLINSNAQQLFSVIQKALFMTDLPLTISYDGDIKRLLSYCRVKFSPLILKSPYDIIKTDLKLHLECADKSCVGLNNVANYLSSTDFKNLLQLNTELNIPVLLIEFTEISNRGYYKDADFYYIDRDFVDWKL